MTAHARSVRLGPLMIVTIALLFVTGCSQPAQTTTPGGDLNRSGSNTSPSSRANHVLTSESGALVTQLGLVDYDRHTLPLVSPDGKYIAVQEGAAPSWDTVLARFGAPPPPTGSIVIYRIEESGERNGGLVLYVHDRLDDVGLLGRNADNNGFLIESPRDAEGTRWLGYVSWEAGEVKWLVQGSSTNAFASLHTDGRIAWCRRDTVDGRFHLIVQGEDSVYRLPAEGGDWLLPVWASDGRTLFAFFRHDHGALDLVALDRRSEILLREPIGTKRVLEDATIRSAYQCLAPLQSPQAPDGTARMLFYHPANNQMALADFERHGVRLLSPDTTAGVWHDPDSFVLAGMDALYRLDGDDPVVNPALPISRSIAVPRRTDSDLVPYVLICPFRPEPGKLVLWALALPEDPTLASEEDRPVR